MTQRFQSAATADARLNQCSGLKQSKMTATKQGHFLRAEACFARVTVFGHTSRLVHGSYNESGKKKRLYWKYQELVHDTRTTSNKSFCPTRIGFLSAVANKEHEAWIYFYGSSIRGLACRSCVSNSVLKLGRLSKAEANIFGHCSLKASL